MSQLQEVYNRIVEKQKKQKDLKTIYKDALLNSKKHQDVCEQLLELKEQKKKIEEEIREEFSSEIHQLENIKVDIQTDKEMLSDLAINQLVKGQTIQIVDQYNNEYEPVFNVKFKKIK